MEWNIGLPGSVDWSVFEESPRLPNWQACWVNASAGDRLRKLPQKHTPMAPGSPAHR